MKAIVLCAGRGTRLRPLSDRIPKAILPVGGRPLLAHTLRWLALEGVHDVVINLHHLGDKIPAAIGDGSEDGVAVTYVREDRLLGTAGSVRNLVSHVAHDDDVLVVYGDLLIDQPLEALTKTHASNGALATLLVHRRAGSNSEIEMDEWGRITRFVERPRAPTRGEHWVNSGVAVLSAELLARFPTHEPSDLPTDVYIPEVGSGRMFAVPLTGRRIAIDGSDRLRQAEEAFEAGEFPRLVL